VNSGHENTAFRTPRKAARCVFPATVPPSAEPRACREYTYIGGGVESFFHNLVSRMWVAVPRFGTHARSLDSSALVLVAIEKVGRAGLSY